MDEFYRIKRLPPYVFAIVNDLKSKARAKGEISSGDTLIIGERAVVEADVRAGRVTVSGEVTGNLRATERVELKRTARVYGDVEAPIVVVEEGVIFEGHCRMAKPTPVAEVAAARDLAVVPLKR